METFLVCFFANMKYCPKATWGGRGLFDLYVTVHQPGKSRQKLTAGTEAEDMEENCRYGEDMVVPQAVPPTVRQAHLHQ